MRPSEFFRPLFAAGLLLAAPLAVAADGLKLHRLLVESEPPGAEVHAIGGRLGVTPLSIPERAIYPNDYPDERLSWYGVIELRHPDCRPWRHRVTLEDIGQGLQARLECERQAPVSPPSARKTASPRAPVAGSGKAGGGEALSVRRLRQLRVLQELLDDGLISAAEEAAIRRRILLRVEE
ncbi:hypothetical protein QVG61_05200 [Thiohalobacter sp. IOR34]|uniref:hypothetical protein n=1 Tax=Thiohalobacter sp. IOR34 TaxID=3057176 RepID=UPI0025AFB6CA|nr:hypothetical protein [Thiohalobacter sp. IOR34]WJW76487.1 hypothetical protein QVG61_05200 [Thiohalobacter sp. IOR34]